jgi:hypothetical protein
MSSPIKQLLEIEQVLKAWIGTDNATGFATSTRADAEHIPPHAERASPEAIAAGTLFSIEHAARFLRNSLAVPFDGVAKIEATAPTLKVTPEGDVSSQA